MPDAEITLTRCRDGTWRLPDPPPRIDLGLALVAAGALVWSLPWTTDAGLGAAAGAGGYGLVCATLRHRRRRRWGPLAGAIALAAAGGAAALAGDRHPALNPAVTADTLTTTVCIRGWTGTIRPPLFVTNSIKRDFLRAAGLGWEHAPEYHLDHIVPLCLGGHPSDTSNLQLQLVATSLDKDRTESTLCCLVCRGLMDLDAARDAVLTWPQPIPGVMPGRCEIKAATDGR